jgi:TRAP-type C4-dicarboxylate transport system substrate-binding protein
LLSEIRELNEDAIPAMQKRGLNVIQVDEATLAHWRSEADKTYPELRGRYAPADLFDEVQRLRDEFRQKNQPASQ